MQDRQSATLVKIQKLYENEALTAREAKFLLAYKELCEKYQMEIAGEGMTHLWSLETGYHLAEL